MYSRQQFYRHARYLHGWFSAFAFLILIFFALTGLFLNNPSWFDKNEQEHTKTITIPQSQLQQFKQQENPTDMILAYLRPKENLIGHFQSSDIVDDEIMIRLENPAGSTDILLTLSTGTAEITTKPANIISVVEDLHKGKYAGKAWSWLIDISAVLILLLSCAGYILFLTMKGRLVQHLILTAMSILLLILFVWLAVS